MNFIGKYVRPIGLLLLTVVIGAAAGLYFDLPASRRKAPAATVAKQTYTCPMHPEIVSDRPDNCSKCGMALVPASQATNTSGHECGDSGESHSAGCCTDNSTRVIQLPPGHPPIPGMTVVTNAQHPAR